jgi:hypothetical protein
MHVTKFLDVMEIRSVLFVSDSTVLTRIGSEVRSYVNSNHTHDTHTTDKFCKIYIPSVAVARLPQIQRLIIYYT